jgi:outer membrane protein TolC
MEWAQVCQSVRSVGVRCVVGLGAALGLAQAGAQAQQPLSLPTLHLTAPGPGAPMGPSGPVVQEMPAPRVLPVLPDAHAKALPINLDTVLRLAQDQNVRVNLSREKLQESFAAKAVADKAWLPELLVGPSYWRHEGGIANEDGTLTHSSFGSIFAGFEMDARLDLREAVYRKVDAERKIWQQRGEVSRMTSETLLDASATYIDLMAAREGEAVALEMAANQKAIYSLAQKRAATDPGAQVEVDRVATEMSAQQQILRRIREKTVAASAKLAYLLGVDPCTELVPTDRRLAPLHLVEASQAACDLVSQALNNGPGIREMEGLLSLIQGSMDKAKGPARFLPVFEVRLGEGAFGTGPGDSALWDNRMDLGIHARWNLTQLATAKDQLRVAQSKLSQAQLSYQDLRGRLALGVQEAREASLSSAEQIHLAEQQIDHARASYKLSNVRLTENIKGSSPSEVLLSIRSLGAAQANYLEAVRDLDKAQLRLMVLLGGTSLAK